MMAPASKKKKKKKMKSFFSSTASTAQFTELWDRRGSLKEQFSRRFSGFWVTILK